MHMLIIHVALKLNNEDDLYDRVREIRYGFKKDLFTFNKHGIACICIGVNSVYLNDSKLSFNVCEQFGYKSNSLSSVSIGSGISSPLTCILYKLRK